MTKLAGSEIQRKPVRWVGSSKEDLREFPEEGGATAPDLLAAPVGRCGRAPIAGNGRPLCSWRLQVAAIRRRVGGALWDAQRGAKAPYAKPFRGFGDAGVLEVVDDFDGNTYRAVYTVRFARIVYVLHAFQKKSTRGIATPKAELNLIARRLKRAQEDYEQWSRSEQSKSR